MEREQIIKALECCVKVRGFRDIEICHNCPLNDTRCAILLPKQALSLINELTEENERLRARRTIDEKFKYCNLVGDTLVYNKTLEDYNKFRADFRADTVKKMHSMLCEGRVSNDNVVIVANQIAKEMLEGEK